jgi:hypothetical protein
MAGLNFQTQTIINANVDKDSNNADLFKAVKTNVDGVEKDVVKIKRDFLFVKDNVKAIRKRAGYNPEMCKAVIDFDQIADVMPTTDEPKKYCRLDLYLGVEGAEPFIYATPWVQKGIPFWVEFTVTNNNKTKVAEHVADMIKKNNLFQIDKDLLKVDAAGNKLTLTGTAEYQRIRKIEINKFAADADYADRVAQLDLNAEDPADVVLEARGKNGFGTYSQIVKDLRLPTAENYQWTHIRQAETPIVGAVYNQYIVEYCAPASNEGLGAVGQRLESHTTHVFWVKRESATVPGALVSAWETALATLGTIVDVQDEIDARTEESSVTPSALED